MIIKSDVFIKLISWFFEVSAITIWPFIIYSPERIKSAYIPSTMRHEKIHLQQQKELLLLGFYVLYVYYFLRQYRHLRNAKAAYLMIPFELEAYNKQYDPNYLETRKAYAWRFYA